MTASKEDRALGRIREVPEGYQIGYIRTAMHLIGGVSLTITRTGSIHCHIIDGSAREILDQFGVDDFEQMRGRPVVFKPRERHETGIDYLGPFMP